MSSRPICSGPGSPSPSEDPRLMIRTQRFSAAVLGLVLAAAACNNDKLNRPFANMPVDPLFERYVSMGNSLTAGWPPDGINDNTQPPTNAGAPRNPMPRT